MTDPLRSDPNAAPAEGLERDRDTRVEELLLSGLDHYFAGHHERAVNVWTRVLFLDRGHARARAYIERARGAIAEGQREGEELVHTGAAAFLRGEPDAARRLLEKAVAQGAGSEEAQAILERLDRLEASAVQQESRALRPPLLRGERVAGLEHGADRRWLGWLMLGLALSIAAGGIAISQGWIQPGEGLPLDSGPRVTALRGGGDPLPVPSVSMVRLARARALHARGHLHEALDALEAVPPGDAIRPEADELRATIQRQLLAAARSGEARATVPDAPRTPNAPRP